MSDTAQQHYKHPSQARAVLEALAELIGVAPEEASALAISGGGTGAEQTVAVS